MSCALGARGELDGWGVSNHTVVPKWPCSIASPPDA